MANKIKEKTNSGNACLQNHQGNLIGFTTPADGEVGDDTNITVSSRNQIKMASDATMELVSEESILNVCKDTIFNTGSKVMTQAKGEFGIEVGDTVKLGLFHMKGPTIKIESGTNSIISSATGILLKRGQFSIAITNAGIKMNSSGAGMTCTGSSCSMSSGAGAGGTNVECGPGGCSLSSGGETVTCGAGGIDCSSMMSVNGVPLTDTFKDINAE